MTGSQPRRVAVHPLDVAVVGCAVFALVFSFVAFYSYRPKGELATACANNSAAVTGPLHQICGGASASAWHGFVGWFGIVLIALAAPAVLIALWRRQLARPARLIGAGSAALGTVCVLVALFVVPDWPPVTGLIANRRQYDASVDDSAGAGLYVVVGLGLLTIVLSVLRVHRSAIALVEH